jgi:predicted DsbA family dithiol-disulfide isomerase
MLGEVRALLVAGLVLVAAPAPAAARPHGATRMIAHRTRESVPVWGLADAPVTVDFFYNVQDYQLPPVWIRLMKLSANHPQRLRIRHHLLLVGANQWLATTALEANSQGRFFELMAEVIVNPMIRSSPTRRDELCARAGVDLARVERADEGGWHLPAMQRAESFMRRRRVTHTRMALLFNGKQTVQQPYSMDDDKLEEAYDAAYERAQDLIDSGVEPHQVYPHLLRELDLAQPVPRVIPGQVDGFLNRRRPQQQEPHSIRLGRLQRGGHRRGPDHARAVIHFFGSLQSRISTQTMQNLDDVREEFDGDLAIVFHDLYDPQDPNQPSAGVAHQLMRCAEDQGSYWEAWDYHVNLITRQLTRARHLTPEDMKAMAQAISIDGDKLVACMKRGRYEKLVEADAAAARAAGIVRTPSLVIGGMLYEGSISPDGIRALVLEQLLPGMLETWAPTEDDPQP